MSQLVTDGSSPYFRVRALRRWARSGCAAPLEDVNPHNTSRRCHHCGHTSAENRKNQAVFSCQGCRLGTNADHNAALNILAAGLLAVTGRGGTPHASAQRPNETSTTRNAA